MLARWVVLLATSACSFALVQGPPSNHRELAAFTCTNDDDMPGLDGAVSIAGALVAAAAAAAAPDSQTGLSPQDRNTTIAVGVGLAVVFAAGALFGVHEVAACHGAQSELARRRRRGSQVFPSR